MKAVSFVAAFAIAALCFAGSALADDSQDLFGGDMTPNTSPEEWLDPQLDEPGDANLPYTADDGDCSFHFTTEKEAFDAEAKTFDGDYDPSFDPNAGPGQTDVDDPLFAPIAFQNVSTNDLNTDPRQGDTSQADVNEEDINGALVAAREFDPVSDPRQDEDRGIDAGQLPAEDPIAEDLEEPMEFPNFDPTSDPSENPADLGWTPDLDPFKGGLDTPSIPGFNNPDSPITDPSAPHNHGFTAGGDIF